MNCLRIGLNSVRISFEQDAQEDKEEEPETEEEKSEAAEDTAGP